MVRKRMEPPKEESPRGQLHGDEKYNYKHISQSDDSWEASVLQYHVLSPSAGLQDLLSVRATELELEQVQRDSCDTHSSGRMLYPLPSACCPSLTFTC